MTFPDFLDRYGLPTALIFIAVAIFERRLWPFAVEQWRKAQQARAAEVQAFKEVIAGASKANEQLLEERRVEREEFLVRLEKRDTEHVIALKEVFQSLNRLDDNIGKLGENVAVLTTEVRTARRKK